MAAGYTAEGNSARSASCRISLHFSKSASTSVSILESRTPHEATHYVGVKTKKNKNTTMKKSKESELWDFPRKL